MRVEVEQLARGLDESNGSRGDGRAIEIGFEVELEGSPGTAGELAQKLPVVAEEHSQPLGDGEDHLAAALDPRQRARNKVFNDRGDLAGVRERQWCSVHSE